MIRIICPNCGTVLDIPDSLAGQSGQCGQCKSQVIVPIPATVDSPAPVPQVDICAQIQAQMDVTERNSAFRKPPVIDDERPKTHVGSGANAKKGCLGCLGVFVILIVAGMIGNMAASRPDQSVASSLSQVSKRPMQSTTALTPPAIVGNSMKVALDTVRASITNPNTRPKPEFLTFKTGTLNGGLAIMSSNSGAYWWSPDGRLYVANGIALAMSPNVPRAPVGVSSFEIESAINGGNVASETDHTPLNRAEIPQTDPVQSQQQDSAGHEDNTVYVGDSGTKYHARNCRTLKHANPILKSQAIERGYAPCAVCGGG